MPSAPRPGSPSLRSPTPTSPAGSHTAATGPGIKSREKRCICAPTRPTQLTSEDIARATPASLFSMLVSDLEGSGQLQRLDGFDRRIWDQIEVGEVVDFEADVEFSAIERLLDLVKRLDSFLPLIAPNSVKDEGWKSFVDYGQLLASQSEFYSVRLEPIGGRGRGCLFVSALNRSHVRGSKDVLLGRYRVLGRVSRKLQPGSSVELFSLLPAGLRIPKEEQRQLVARFKSMPSILGSPPSVADLQVPYPAMLLTTVAIYR